MKKLIGSALFGACFSFLSGASIAQNAPFLPNVAKVPIVLQTNYTKSSIRQDGQGSFFAASDNTLNKNSALSSFYLGFLNGDHKIRGIGLMPDADTAHVMFIDNDSNDPLHVNASWWNIPGAVGGTVEFPPNSHISDLIPPGPPNSTLVIGGFNAYISEWTDCDIWNFAVKFNPTNDRMIIEMGSNCNKVKGRRGAYVWVPNSLISANKIVTGSQRGRNQVSGTLPPSDKYLIRAFDFQFKNGGHHLYSMGVMLQPPIASVVSWQDNNLDDPIQWRVDYSVLK